jgi:hypothetical protein
VGRWIIALKEKKKKKWNSKGTWPVFLWEDERWED